MASNVSISGLVSNMDTETIIKQLVDAYSIRKDNLVKAQTKLEWKQDAWKELNSKIYGFYSGKLSAMRFSSAFSVKKSTSTSSKATVTAGADAPTGTQKLKIRQLATAGYLTGGKVKRADASNTSNIKGSDTLSALGMTEDGSIAVKLNGETKNITLKADMTVNQAVVKLKEAGVNASFDEVNQRFFVSSKNSGAAGDFSLTANDNAGIAALNAIGLNLATATDVEDYRKTAAMTDEELAAAVETAYAKQQKVLYDITDTEAMDKVKKNLEAARDKAKESNEKLEKDNKTNLYKQAALNEVKDLSLDDKQKLYGDTTDRIAQLGKIEDATDEEKAELEMLKAKSVVYKDALSDTFAAEKYGEDLQKAIDSNNEIIASNNETIAVADTALADEEGFENYIIAENDKINAENDKLKEDLNTFYSTKRADADTYIKAYDLVNQEGVDKTSQEYKDALAIVGEGNTDGTGAVRITGQDAIIELNGATFTSNSNNFQVNGLTINVNALTDVDAVTGVEEEISITTDTDVDGIYNMIKDFFKEYNELIKEMDSKYNAASAKGYEPLIDSEKEAMSDKEIEKWEEKVKGSLLRRDSTLDGVMTSMTSSFMKMFDINGKSYSLSSFGITTSGYLSSGDNEQYTYHIDGDKDDSRTSGKTDKLRAAIASDPEGICEFFNKLADNVYTELSNKMRMTSLSSAYTVYNDKKMKNDYDEYSKKISDWEDKIEAYEERYRKQFTAMEKALAQLNSNTSALAGLMSF